MKKPIAIVSHPLKPSNEAQLLDCWHGISECTWGEHGQTAIAKGTGTGNMIEELKFSYYGGPDVHCTRCSTCHDLLENYYIVSVLVKKDRGCWGEESVKNIIYCMHCTKVCSR